MSERSRNPLGKDKNPGGAKWCETHNRLECTKNRSRGRGPCHCRAVRGTAVCQVHGGKKLAILKAQGAARITAWTPFGQAANPISAPMAVLGVLQMSWLRLAAYSELLRQQVQQEHPHVDNPRYVDEPETSGLIGFRYGAAGKDGIVYVQSEEVRALVNLEAAERDRIVKYAKVAHDMGISERLIQLAERWGDMVADAVTTMLNALDLTPEQAAMVPTLVQSHLGSIDLEKLGAADKTVKKEPAA